MSDHVYLSATSVAIILVGVALLAMLVALALGIYGNPERSHKVVLFGSLIAIWATAILVVVYIRLPI